MYYFNRKSYKEEKIKYQHAYDNEKDRNKIGKKVEKKKSKTIFKMSFSRFFYFILMDSAELRKKGKVIGEFTNHRRII